MEWLRFVTGRFQGVEMAVLSHDEIGIAGDCAIAELIVIGIHGDHIETKPRFHELNIPVKLRKHIQ